MAEDFSSPESSGDNRELSVAEAEEARRLFEALLAFRDAYPDMTVAQAAALLLIASSPSPVSMTEIRQSVGVAASTATRAILTLSNAKRGARGAPGPALVEQSVDPTDKRWRLTRCTAKGYAAARQVILAARREAG